jgi:hypothetical protein
MHEPDGQKNLMLWLMTQERVIRMWRDEVLSAASSNADLLEKLKEHRRWLAGQIDELTRQKRRLEDMATDLVFSFKGRHRMRFPKGVAGQCGLPRKLDVATAARNREVVDVKFKIGGNVCW